MMIILVDKHTELTLPLLQKGDIFLTRGNSLISKLVRVFSHTGGESRTYVNHTGLVCKATPGKGAVVIEALTRVQMHRLSYEYGSTNTLVTVYRPRGLSEEELENVVTKATSYLGDSYGYAKIFAHFGDWLLGGRYFFRRFASMDKYPICSWLVAASYATAGRSFGCAVGQAEPDDIWDYVRKHPEEWECIWPL